MCQTVENIAFMTEALEAARGVDAGMVTRPVKRTLVNVLACPLIGQQLVALLAAALEAAHCVPTYVITPPVVQATLVNVFAGLAVWLESEAYRTAAADSGHCIVTCAVTATVVH